MAGGNANFEDQYLYSPNCTLFDKTLQEIAAIWNSAFLSLPSKSNPALESPNEDNIRSANLQTYEKIWFLVGAVDNKPKIRTIDVPVGWPLFVPIVTRDTVALKSSADFTELYEDARKYKKMIDSQTLNLEIDDCTFDYSSLNKYYLESIPFNVLVPQDNVYKGTDEPIDGVLEDKVVVGVCSGIFVPVRPLPLLPTPHTISFYAKHAREEGKKEFEVKVKYTINIVAKIPPKFSGLAR
jgi:hypothetical protein